VISGQDTLPQDRGYYRSCSLTTDRWRLYLQTLAGGKFSGVQASRRAAKPCRRAGNGEVTQ
jgi:hypothetical protein